MSSSAIAGFGLLGLSVQGPGQHGIGLGAGRGAEDVEGLLLVGRRADLQDPVERGDGPLGVELGQDPQPFGADGPLLRADRHADRLGQFGIVDLFEGPERLGPGRAAARVAGDHGEDLGPRVGDLEFADGLEHRDPDVVGGVLDDRPDDRLQGVGGRLRCVPVDRPPEAVDPVASRRLGPDAEDRERLDPAVLRHVSLRGHLSQRNGVFAPPDPVGSVERPAQERFGQPLSRRNGRQGGHRVGDGGFVDRQAGFGGDLGVGVAQEGRGLPLAEATERQDGSQADGGRRVGRGLGEGADVGDPGQADRPGVAEVGVAVVVLAEQCKESGHGISLAVVPQGERGEEPDPGAFILQERGQGSREVGPVGRPGDVAQRLGGLRPDLGVAVLGQGGQGIDPRPATGATPGRGPRSRATGPGGGRRWREPSR